MKCDVCCEKGLSGSTGWALTQNPGGGLSLVVKNKSSSDGQVETGHPQTSTENAIAQRSERMVLLRRGQRKCSQPHGWWKYPLRGYHLHQG